MEQIRLWGGQSLQQFLRVWCTASLRLEWLTLVVQLCLLVSIVLDVPILRPVLASVYLILVPGAIVLQLLQVRVSLSVFLVYAVALSTVLLMLVGMVANTLLPAIGIAEPFSLGVVVPVMMLPVTVGLLYSLWTVDQPFPIQTDLAGVPVRYALLLVTFPLLSVVGTGIYLNLHGNVYPNVVLFLLVAATPLLLIARGVDRRAAVAVVWAVSITILLDMGLVSQYIWGWDIHLEAFISRRVLENNVWQMTFQNKINSMATYSILAPVYVRFSGLSLALVFKILYPLLFSVVPVGIYLVVEEVFDQRIAALSPFVFMFFYGFFKNMPHKQYLAEIFLIAVLVVIFTRHISGWRARLLLLLFGVGAVVSHYAATALFIPFIGVLVVGIFVFNRIANIDPSRYTVDRTFVIFLFALFTSWYVFVGGGITIGLVIERILIEVFSVSERAVDPPTRSGAGFLAAVPGSLGWLGFTFLSGVLIAAIGVGLAGSLVRLGQKLSQEKQTLLKAHTAPIEVDATRGLYDVFAAGLFSLILVSVILPLGLGIDRILQLVLVALSPYSLVGLRYIFEALDLDRRAIGRYLPESSPTAVLAVLLTAYLVLSSGAASALVQETVPDHAIAVTENELNGEWNVYTDPQVDGAEWLVRHGTAPEVATTEESNRYRPDFALMLTGYYGFMHTVEPISTYGERFIDSSSPVEDVKPGTTIPDGVRYGYVGEPLLAPELEASERGESIYNQYEARGDRIYHNGQIMVYTTDGS